MYLYVLTRISYEGAYSFPGEEYVSPLLEEGEELSLFSGRSYSPSGRRSSSSRRRHSPFGGKYMIPLLEEDNLAFLEEEGLPLLLECSSCQQQQ